MLVTDGDQSESKGQSAAASVGGRRSSGQAEDSMSEEATDPVTRPEPAKRSLRGALVHEVRTHPFGYSVLAVFVLLSPFAISFLFPQAPPAVAAVGGLAFAVYAALCAVPQKFL